MALILQHKKQAQIIGERKQEIIISKEMRS